jgi:hypothetical protein
MAIHLKKMTDWLGADVCIDASAPRPRAARCSA